MKKIDYIFFVTLVTSLTSAWGYEIETHEALSSASVNASILKSDDSRRKDIGLDKDIGDVTQTFPDSTGTFRSVLDLVKFGASLEDNVQIFSLNPEVRVTKHFFNPLTGSGLRHLGSEETASPDWALEDRSDDSRQAFSYKDARRAFLDGLIKVGEDDRKKGLGRTFQNLGHVVHHIQDMAQPQHVRNDIHCDKPICFPLNAFAPSGFEADSKSSTVLRQIAEIGLPQGYLLSGQSFNNIYSTPRKFWHTEAAGLGSPQAGKGLAEFTQRNFVSAGTNFWWLSALLQANSDFPLPAPTGNEEVKRIEDGDLLGTQQPLRGEIRFITSQIQDNFLGQSVGNARQSTYSIFDPDLIRANRRPVFSLNRFNYEDARKYLLPRAVAYSAGLINYFFRGKLDYVDDPQSAGVKRIRNLSKESMTGTFAFYYDAMDGNRYPVPNAKWESIALPPYDASITDAGNPAYGFAVAFSPPVDPAPKNDAEYMLVFNGDLGEEKAGNGSVGAVAAKSIKPELSGFVVDPNYRPADGVAGARLISFANGQWKLNTTNAAQAGNIDWKGAYVDGKPTKVLSWYGFRGRYRAATSFAESPFTPNIYQGGDLYAVAPGPVVGAALTKDGTGAEWIVAVVGTYYGNSFYVRPSGKSASNALFAPGNANGWREAGSYAPPYPNLGAWFFNGAGNEAQRVANLLLGLGRAKVSLDLSNPAAPRITSAEIPYPRNTPTTTNQETLPYGDQTGGIGDQCGALVATSFGLQTVYTGEDIRANVLLGVDYIDGQEVFANVQTLAARYSNSTFDHTKIDSTLTYGGNPAQCRIARIQRTVVSESGANHISNGGKSYQLGTLRIDGGSSSASNQTSRRTDVYDVQCNPLCSPTQTGVNLQVGPQTPVTTLTDSLSLRTTDEFYDLLYFDLRSNFAVLYRRSEIITATGLPAVYAPTQHAETVDVYQSGSRTTYPLAAFVGNLPGCAATGCFQSAEASLGADQAKIGYARDVTGREAFSVDIKLQSLAPVGQDKYFNSLSGGTFGTVIPGAPAEAAYFPIGLVK